MTSIGGLTTGGGPTVGGGPPGTTAPPGGGAGGELFIRDLRPYMKSVNCVFIVLDQGKTSKTRDFRSIYSFKVADRTACIDLNVWDEPGRHIQPGDIFKLVRGYTSVFRDCLVLYSGTKGTLTKIGEFCMIFSEGENMSDPGHPIVKEFLASQQQQHSSTTATSNIAKGDDAASSTDSKNGGKPLQTPTTPASGSSTGAGHTVGGNQSQAGSSKTGGGGHRNSAGTGAAAARPGPKNPGWSS